MNEMFQHSLHPTVSLASGSFFLILVHRQFQNCYAQPDSEQNRTLNVGFPPKLTHWSLLLLHFVFHLFFNLYFCSSLLIEYRNIHSNFPPLPVFSEAPVYMSLLTSDKYSSFSSNPCTVLNSEGVGRSTEGQGVNLILVHFGPKCI